jgi:hypothetical protein
MKIYCIIFGCFLSISLAEAAPKLSLIRDAALDPNRIPELYSASADTQEFAQSVAQTLRLIAASKGSEAVREDRLTMVVAIAVRSTGNEVARFVELLTAQIPEDMIPIVSASAVLAGKTQSPEILQALLLGAGTSEPIRKAVRLAGSAPVSVLGETRAVAVTTLVSGEEVSGPVAPTAMDPVDSPKGASVAATVSRTRPKVLSDEPPLPPAPPPLPPRPPAIPYRGQR